MTSMHSTATVFLLMATASAIPGPGDVLVVTAALERGFIGSLRVMAGILLGDVLFILMALLGIHSLNTLFPGAGSLIRAMGLVVLLGVCARLFFTDAAASRRAGFRRTPGVMRGFVVTLSDPTAIGFYAALLPQLTDGRAVRTVDALVMLVCAATAIGSVKSAYAAAAIHLGRQGALSPRIQKRLRRFAAAALLLLTLTLFIPLL